jgi:hypothetical protein
MASSLINDVIFLVLSIRVAIRLVVSIKNNYFLSNKIVLISILLYFIIIYYRCCSSVWNFTSSYLFEHIKYVDLIIMFLVSNIIIRCVYKVKQCSVDSKKGFYFDNPIRNLGDDTLNCSSIAKIIIEKIKNTANPDSSFAIGISSEWGRGKTSFLNLIESGLNEKSRIIIHFNPWLNNDDKAIVKSFFDELSGKLKKYNKELSNKLLTYSKMLFEIGSTEISMLSKIFPALFKSTNDLRQQFKDINKAILSSSLQIIIFIDDLDRLYEKEVLEVLKLIRNSASFANTVFVVAYDRNYLISALSKVNEHHPNFYLEKIFQVEIPLPVFYHSVIVNKLKEMLIPHMEECDKKKLENILKNTVGNHIANGNYFRHYLLKNLRDANHFVNSFLMSYEALKGEVMLVDLLNIELLRIRFLGVYMLLADDYNSYLATKGHNKNIYLTLKKEKVEDKEKDRTILEEYLDENYKEVGIQKNQIANVLKYVNGIFPDYDVYSARLELTSIANPIGIDRYFYYNLLNSNLSEIEFSHYRNESDNVFLVKIKEWIEKGLQSEVARRLERIEHYLNKEDYEKIIKAIFYYASLPTTGRSDCLGFDGDNLMWKLDYNKVKFFYPERESFMDFVEQLFVEQYPPFLFVSVFIDHIFKNNISEWHFILKEDFLKRQKIKYFNTYAEVVDRFDQYLFWLYQYCKYKEWVKTDGKTYHSTEIEPEEAKAIFIKCASRIPESFIKNIISKKPLSDDNPLFSIPGVVFEIWGSWDAFESFIFLLNDEEVKGLKEFKLFYSKCKEVNFGHYIEFNFKDIDLSDALLFNM